MSQFPSSIVVVRAGALGDLVFCLQSFAEIRNAFPSARLALLTRRPFAAFAKAMPWFDTIILDTHPRSTDWRGWTRLVGEIRRQKPDLIFDLQGKTRQTILYTLMGGPLGPDWSGAAPMCKYPRLWPPTPGMKFTAFLAAQLRNANIPALAPVQHDWLDAPVDHFALPENYVVLIAGSSPGADFKRWPAEKFAALANHLKHQGIASITVGTAHDRKALEPLLRLAPDSRDLSGQTDLFQLAGLCRRAVAVIGNDTGPTHLAAATGSPTLALFSARSDRHWSFPPGPRSAVAQAENLANLSTEEVLNSLNQLIS